MSDLAQAAVVSGSMFAVVMLSQYGRRHFRTKDLIRPLIMVAVFGWLYLVGMPTGAHVDAAYAVALALGLLFGAGATLATRVEREPGGAIVTRCGPAFAGVWLLAVGLRLGFVWAVTNVGPFREHVGAFMLDHRLPIDAIAPFFVIWALTMVVSRIAVVAVRARALAARPAADVIRTRDTAAV